MHAETKRTLEGRVISLDGDNVVMFMRVPTGRIWESRSADDGQTWSEMVETTLVHPDAPPMVYGVDPDDPNSLVALIHNRTASHVHQNPSKDDRRELWVCRSTDGGKSWSVPRFLMANACTLRTDVYNWSEVGYADLLVDGTTLHIFLSHNKRQILYARINVSDLDSLLTQEELARIADDGVTA